MSPTPQTYRILVVEDTPDQRAIIKLSLSPFEVVTAEHGLDGLMKLERVEPDFIISDVMMPEMDGWEFVRNVRQRAGHENTPVIYLTALSSRDDMKKGYETGADVYLTKPYDPVRLRKNIDVYIEKFKLPIKPKKFTLAEIEAEDSRIAQTPRVPPRVTVRPSLAEEQLEAPLAPEQDPFKPAAPPPKLVPPPIPAPPRAPTPLPTTPPPTRVAHSLEPSKSKEAQPVRFLLITADPTLAREVKVVCDHTHAELVAADASPSAMNKMSLYRPDAVLLHWQMPENHGPALAQLFSESVECRGRPVVVVTDKAFGRGDRRQADSFGVFDVLKRPLSPQSVSDLVTDLGHFLHGDLRRTRMPWDQVEKREEALRKAMGPEWEG